MDFNYLKHKWYLALFSPLLLIPPISYAHLFNISNLNPDTKISQVALLGAHDAGTYGIEKLEDFTVTQNMGLLDQADLGVRYFDIRVRKEGEHWYFYHGEKSKLCNGFTNYRYNALVIVRNLVSYAVHHPQDLFILKLHFDETANSSKEIYNFINDILYSGGHGYSEHFITHDNSNTKYLGGATLQNTVLKGHNIAILSNHIGEEASVKLANIVWDYKSNTNTKWGATVDAHKLIKTLKNNLVARNPDKITISQTNFPGISPQELRMPGLRKVARENHAIVASALENDPNWHGIISIDFVGNCELSSTKTYLDMINAYNKGLMHKK